MLVVGERDRRGRRRPDRARGRPSRSTPTGGIVMPGMIDTHRHLWQTAMRGYGADWTLTQYFVWYYLESGKLFRPEDIYAGNLLAAIEAIDAGVTTTVDWSHGLQTPQHADAAVDALRGGAGPVRPGLRQHPAGARGSGRPAPSSATSSAAGSHGARRHARLPAGLRRDRRPGLPGEGRVRGRPRARRAGHHPRRRVGRHQRRRHPAHARARFHDAARRSTSTRPRSPPTRTTGSPPPAARSRCPPRASRAPARATRPPGSCASTTSRCRCRWTPASGGAATCSRRCAPRWAPTGRASTWRRTPARRPSPTTHLRAEQVVDWATRGGSRALGLDSSVGSLKPGKKADVVLIKNDRSPVDVPDPQPVRARRLPGPARRRAHRHGQRPAGQAGPPAGRRRPAPPPGTGSSRPSSTWSARWARKPGTRA